MAGVEIETVLEGEEGERLTHSPVSTVDSRLLFRTCLLTFKVNLSGMLLVPACQI